MSDKNTGGAAFPILADVRPHMDKEWCGMTLRDYFAAKAMQGLISAWGAHDVTDFSELSHDSYRLADAMLRERENT